MKNQLVVNSLKKYINKNALRKVLTDSYNLFFDLYLILYFLPKKNINNKGFIIVTGADSSHFNSLVNLLNSIKKYEPSTSTKAYNLGMSDDEIAYLKSTFDFDIIDFEFDKYPKFVSEIDNSNKLGSYAWKPIIVYNEYMKSGKNLLWLDAGCLLKGRLSLLKKMILKNGFYSPLSSNKVKDWTHLKTIKKLSYPNNLLNANNFSSGLVGLATDDEIINGLVTEWYKNSLHKEIIAPEGSSRLNHRQDQAVLTLLVNLRNLGQHSLRTHKIFGLLKHQDNEVYKHLN